MMPMALLLLFSYTLVLATIVVASVPSHSSSSFAGLHRIQHRHSTTSNIQHHNTNIHKILQVRGGGNDDDEYDSEYDSEEVEEEPIVTKTKRLSSSTKQKVQRAKSAQVKSKVKVAMMSSSSAKSSASAGKQNSRSLYKRFVPYIIRACINPFTLLAMTKSYFVSLCDINYLKEVRSCSLLSVAVAGVGKITSKRMKNTPPPRFMYIYTTSFVN